jgi:Zn-dependent M16 (insulinase) family peptidase
MTIIHGFELVSEQTITELKTLAKFYRHQKTGAELLSLSNDDENKVFGITFRTPPTDSTGVAHILEHSVLCGSRKYPVKEPFVELLKGSLNTFLNAFTYPDKTCYPLASQNLQDFYNLIDVYLDAVFYPRLTPFVFHQEGWHFELEKETSPLIYKGVVFNEMKGAYSSPENVLAEYSLQSLFPDNSYGFDSGGDPKQIPNLTFEQFEAFHRTYYHPSNSRLYFYGDDDPEKRLKFLNESLKNFDHMEVNSSIPLQPPFDRSRRLVHSFIVGDENSEKVKKGMFTLNWVIAESGDVQTNFALRIIEYILLGMPASPLRKALIDSGLGEDIAGEGLGTELRQIYFSTGLKGIDIENVHRIEGLIKETLETLAQKGIDPRTIEAALNTVEFRLRENNTGHFPRGLSLMLRSLTTWLYDKDPLSLLGFEAPLDSIKAQVKSNNSFFEQIIDTIFLKNLHCTALILKPDPALREREEADEKELLSRARAGMNASQVESVIANTRELRRLQETPDPPEALATIPVLKLTDLERENKKIPLARLQRKGSTILFHDLFTNSIAYFDIGFDLHKLPQKYLQYVPLFGRALVEMGTEKEDFVTLTQRISRKTGGIRSQVFTSTVKQSKRSAAWLFLRGKAMLNQTEELAHILKDILLTVKLDNQKRFRQMLLEEKARTEQGLIPSGHQFVNLRLRAHFGESHWASEQMGGISYLFFLRKLIRAVEKNWPEVLSTLEKIFRILVNRKAMVFNITLDNNNWSGIENHISNLISTLPETAATETDWFPEVPDAFEGLTIPSKVNYVGKGANLFDLGYRFHGSSLVITRYLRNSWLWEQVRVQGGAYGAFCLFDRTSGVLTFVSYRDPNILKTLKAFDQTGPFLSGKNIEGKELTKGIIGAIGDLDAHMLPDAKGYISMLRYLTGDTEKDRQQMRDEIMTTKPADFKAFADILEKVKKEGIIKILGSPSAIEAEMAHRPEDINVLEVL